MTSPSAPTTDLPITQLEGGCRFEVRVKPRAARAAVLGLRDGALEVAVTAAPVDGAANQALLAALADYFSIPKSRWSIEGGQTHRRKLVMVRGVDAAALRRPR